MKRHGMTTGPAATAPVDAAAVNGGAAVDIVAPCLYYAEVGHIRQHPVKRRFSHRVYYWLIDLDEPNPAPRWLRPLARFTAADHMGEKSTSIKDNLLAYLAAHNVDLAGGRIVMLANARSFGYVFNPITVYWCYDADGSLVCIVAEVHNTYHQLHNYLLRPDAAGRVSQSKDFYVSPFLSVDGEYLMRFSPPGARLAITIALRQHGTTVFTATVTGRRRDASTRQLLRALVAYPAMGIVTAIWIRSQGIRLLVRRLPLFSRKGMRPDGLRANYVPREPGTPSAKTPRTTTRTADTDGDADR